MRSQLTIKADVYSFRGFKLELITERRAVDFTRPASDQVLINWVKPTIRERRRYHELVDPLPSGENQEKDLSQAVRMAAMCLFQEASARAYMSDDVVTLGFLADVPDSCKGKPNTVPQKKGAD